MHSEKVFKKLYQTMKESISSYVAQLLYSKGIQRVLKALGNLGTRSTQGTLFRRLATFRQLIFEQKLLKNFKS